MPAVFSVEFACLEAMRSAHSMFLDDIVAHSQRYRADVATGDTSAEDVRVASLRSDNIFHVAEFYFQCEHHRLNDPVRFAEFIDRHNDKMRELLKSAGSLRQRGLLAYRVKTAIFSDEQKAKVVETAIDKGRLRLDQSDIGRFLSPVISPETCRKTLACSPKADCSSDAISAKPDVKLGKRHLTLPGKTT